MVLRLNLVVFSFSLLIGVYEVNSSNCQHRFSCGDFARNPDPNFFGVKGHDPRRCGSRKYQLYCDHNNRTALYIGRHNSDEHYYVTDGDVLMLLDPGVQKNNCSSLPLYSFEGSPSFYDGYLDRSYLMIFASCKKQVNSPNYIDTSTCLAATPNGLFSSGDQSRYYSYVIFWKATEMEASDIEETCTVYRSIISPFPSLSDDFGQKKTNLSFQDVHEAIAAGYEFYIPYIPSPFFGYLDMITPTAVIVIAAISSASLPFIIILNYRRRHLSKYEGIEEFLRRRNNMVPIRYSYSQIKNITNDFKEKLGEGGYGSVYKGKLQSDQLVAVKLLTKSKANNGQDFINEVTTLGRIHHVNVVRLVGFCATASKQALIYDYMPNGSLDKFIFAEEINENTYWKWNKINEVAVGVARGIGYLHEGCNIQILHFDIKPHNILLDQNFVPKVSDFGLAKLHEGKDNAISVTAAGGTLGYMAPELFYNRVGEISFKADVYSFGMLLMEMAGRRRNVNANADHSSQIYFPTWVYDHFEKGREELDWLCTDFGEEEKEKIIAKKLILIALLCIQMKPDDRPSMKEVVKMLHAEDSKILPKLPPRPRFYPTDSPVVLEGRTLGSVDQDDFTESLSESVSIKIEPIV